MCYSEGFSPHMIMSFASPLGLGITSDGEYMDIGVKTSPSSAEAVRRLNEVMVEGIDVVSWKLLPEDCKNAMASVAAADYEIRFRNPREGWQEKFLEFLKEPEIFITKETKKGCQQVDIRPWVYRCQVKDQVISMQVSAGSVNNLKPEVFMEAFGAWADIPVSRSALLIHRAELYADRGTDGVRDLITLEEMGEDIG